MLPIKSIKKSDSLRWTVGNRYSRICEEFKTVASGNGTRYEIIMYRVYDHDDNIIVEIESNSGLVIERGNLPEINPPMPDKLFAEPV